MTKIKLCGLLRSCDIMAANELMPDYIGFVFAPKSKRYISPQDAKKLKAQLSPQIRAVGVFVDEKPETIATLLEEGIIDAAQLHGSEDEAYIRQMKRLTEKPLIKAFRVNSKQDIAAAQMSMADAVLLDSGSGGRGIAFDWDLIFGMKRPYFLAGGLNAGNVKEAVERLHPYAVDVSSGIETGGKKDKEKMAAFVQAVRSVKGDKEER